MSISVLAVSIAFSMELFTVKDRCWISVVPLDGSLSLPLVLKQKNIY